MGVEEKRKHTRYDAFVPLTIFVPGSWGNNKLEINGWIKDVSREGVALEICIMTSEEIIPLKEIVDNKQRVVVSITVPDDLTKGDSKIEAQCNIVWGKFAKKQKFYFYNIGLSISRINPLQKPIWDSFLEKFSAL